MPKLSISCKILRRRESTGSKHPYVEGLRAWQDMKALSIVLLAIVLYLLISSYSTLAEDLPGDRGAAPAPAVESAKIDKEYEFLKEQTAKFMEFVQQEREKHQKFLEWTISIVGGAFIAIVAFATFVGIKSIRKMVNRITEDWLDQYIGGRLKNTRVYIDDRIQNERASFNEIMEDKWREKSNLASRICFLVPGSLHQEIKENEFAMIKRRGFGNVALKDVSEPIDTTCDLFIFYYDDSLANELTNLVSSLESNPRPLVVYYPGRVENEALNRYKWRSFANTPLTLVQWVFTIMTNLEIFRQRS